MSLSFILVNSDSDIHSHTLAQLEDKINAMRGDLARTRQELDNQQSERTKIAYVDGGALMSVTHTFRLVGTLRRRPMRSSRMYTTNYCKQEWIRMSRRGSHD